MFIVNSLYSSLAKNVRMTVKLRKNREKSHFLLITTPLNCSSMCPNTVHSAKKSRLETLTKTLVLLNYVPLYLKNTYNWVLRTDYSSKFSTCPRKTTWLENDFVEKITFVRFMKVRPWNSGNFFDQTFSFQIKFSHLCEKFQCIATTLCLFILL